MTYDEIAEKLGVGLCKACPAEVARKPGTHYYGWAGLSGSTKVHWRERQVRRQGLYRFLKLVTSVKLGTQAMRAGPERTWLEAAGAFDLALSLGVRFSREILADDRARVRSWLAGGWGQNMDDDTRRKVSRWSR